MASASGGGGRAWSKRHPGRHCGLYISGRGRARTRAQSAAMRGEGAGQGGEGGGARREGREAHRSLFVELAARVGGERLRDARAGGSRVPLSSGQSRGVVESWSAGGREAGGAAGEALLQARSGGGGEAEGWDRPELAMAAARAAAGEAVTDVSLRLHPSCFFFCVPSGKCPSLFRLPFYLSTTPARLGLCRVMIRLMIRSPWPSVHSDGRRLLRLHTT